MIKTAIIDDSDVDRVLLKRSLEEYAEKHSVSFDVKEYKSAEEFFESSHKDVKLIFLDIYMEGISGIELGKKLRSTGNDFSMVLVSGSNEYASEAFEIHADYYIKKPVDPVHFEKCMSVVLCKCFDNEFVEIYTDRVQVKLYVKNIIYVETGARKLVLHTVDGDYETYMAISNFLKMLPEGLFVRSSRFEAVSLMHIDRINLSDIYLDNGVQLALSPKMYDEVVTAFHEFRLRFN